MKRLKFTNISHLYVTAYATNDIMHSVHMKMSSPAFQTGVIGYILADELCGLLDKPRRKVP